MPKHETVDFIRPCPGCGVKIRDSWRKQCPKCKMKVCLCCRGEYPEKYPKLHCEE